MKRFLLTLLASPALLGSALCYFSVLPQPMHASEAVVQVSENLACDRATSRSQRQFTCVRLNNAAGKTDKEIIDLTKMPVLNPIQLDDNPDMLEFTEEESNAAVALFGCDCPVCLNSIRQLQAI